MQVNSNICGSSDLPLIAHSPSPIAYSLLPYSPSPTFYVTIVAELFPLVMVLRRVLTYYGANVAEIIDKRG